MAYVQGSLGEKISKTMDDAAALFKQGDYQQSIDMFARAWDLLPDSKYSYDESYLIVWRILIVALKANTFSWLIQNARIAENERCGERGSLWLVVTKKRHFSILMLPWKNLMGDVLKEAILPLKKHT